MALPGTGTKVETVLAVDDGLAGDAGVAGLGAAETGVDVAAGAALVGAEIGVLVATAMGAAVTGVATGAGAAVATGVGVVVFPLPLPPSPLPFPPLP